MDRQQKNISSELPEIQVRTWPLVEFRSRSYRKEKVRQNTLIHLKSAYWLGSGLNLSPSLMSLRSRVGNDPPQLCVSSFISGKVSSKDYNSIWPWILPWGRMLDLRSSKKKSSFLPDTGGVKANAHVTQQKQEEGMCIRWMDGWSFGYRLPSANWNEIPSFLERRHAPGKVIRFCGRHKFQFAFFAK